MNDVNDTWTNVVPIAKPDVDHFVSSSVGFVMQYGTADCGRFELSLREMIEQALGQGYQAGAKEVICRIERIREYVFELSLGFPAEAKLKPAIGGRKIRRPANTGSVHLSIARTYADYYEQKKDRIIARFTILPLDKEFEVTDSPTGKRITPATDLISPFADKFKRCLLDLVKAGQQDLVIDFRNVTIVDSRCLGVLIAANKAIKQERPDLALKAENVNSRVMELFRLTCLTQIFTFLD
jgi:anti-anti-sigma factor